MYFLLLFLSIIAVFIIALFFEPVAIYFSLDTDKMDMHALAKWTRIIKIQARVINNHLFITAYILRLRIYAGHLKPGKKSGSKKTLFEALDLSRTHAKISYGFSEPYLTGIFCAAADFAASLLQSADIELEPEFLPENEYLIIAAETQLNAGKTLINMIRMKFENAKRRKNYGPA